MSPRLKYQEGRYDWGNLSNMFILQLPEHEGRDKLASLALVEEAGLLLECTQQRFAPKGDVTKDDGIVLPQVLD